MPQDKTSELISNIITAVSSCALYSEKHPVVDEFSEKALSLINDLYAEDSLSFIMIGDSLIFNDVPYTERGGHVITFLKRLKRKKIEKIIFRKGLELEEFRKFIVGMASGDVVTSSPHISIGIIEVRIKDPNIDTTALMNEGLSKVRDAFQGISRFKSLDMVGLEDAVADFVLSMKRESNMLRIISPVKSHSEYTYVHTTNVAVLTIFQAESLGLKEEGLHDAGLAGLLHDVGKMFVSTAVIDKQTKLDPEEWTEMKKHPVYGAIYLSKIPDAPSVAAIAAFEHHMKFDGSGYPETKRYGKKQHIISQLVAISDFFDALRSERSYRKSLDVPTIARIMKEGSGKDFNPKLLDSFLSALGKII